HIVLKSLTTRSRMVGSSLRRIDIRQTPPVCNSCAICLSCFSCLGYLLFSNPISCANPSAARRRRARSSSTAVAVCWICIAQVIRSEMRSRSAVVVVGKTASINADVVARNAAAPSPVAMIVAGSRRAAVASRPVTEPGWTVSSLLICRPSALSCGLSSDHCVKPICGFVLFRVVTGQWPLCLVVFAVCMRPFFGAVFRQSFEEVFNRFGCEQLTPQFDKQGANVIGVERPVVDLAVMAWSRAFEVAVVALNDRVID